MSLYFMLPPSSLFSLPKYPSTIEDIAASLPSHAVWLTSLFKISLKVSFPLYIVVIYTAVVVSVNNINRRRKNKPWIISRPKLFGHMVCIHNMSLALFSGWIFSLSCSIVFSSWPQVSDALYRIRAADLLCQGGRTRSDVFAHNSPHGAIDTELHFVGWIFYLSKVYEVVDTAIILAKGRQASRLHVYHHAGIIFCAWAATRFRSPPALVILFLNSAVHTLMYSYYTLTAMHISVPKRAKATMTGIQISQFLIAYLLSLPYMFVRYDIPVSLRTNPNGGQMACQLPSLSNLGLQLSPGEAACEYNYETVNCLRNSGEAAVLWLGFLYGAPLTYMFVDFFVKSYRQSGGKKIHKVE